MIYNSVDVKYYLCCFALFDTKLLDMNKYGKFIWINGDPFLILFSYYYYLMAIKWELNFVSIFSLKWFAKSLSDSTFVWGKTIFAGNIKCLVAFYWE